MDKNSYIGLALIALVLIVFGILNQPSQEEIEAIKRKQDSIAKIERERIEKIKAEQRKKDSLVNLASKSFDTSFVQEKKLPKGPFSHRLKGVDKYFTLENDLIKVTLSNKGGKIKTVELKNYKTHDKEPLYLLKDDSARFTLKFQLANENDKLHYELISTENYYFEPSTTDNYLTTEHSDSVVISFKLYADTVNKNKFIEFAYTLRKSSYLLTFSINVVGFKDQILTHEFIDYVFENTPESKEKSVSTERSYTTIYYKYLSDDEVDYLSETSDDSKKLDTKVKWIGFKEHFFTTVLISEKGFVNAEIKAINHSESYTKLRTLSANIGIPYNPNKTEPHNIHIYFGPNKYQILKSFDLELEKQIPLGWGFFLMAWVNRFIVIPVFNLLETTGMNYGIIILILTIIIKILLFPIAYKTYISSAKMKILKPDIDAINKKYPNQEDMMKKQQEIMNLYKRAGVNPLAGCVPMLLQLPILIALFRFFPSAIELRQQPFLWADDLSSYDSILDLGFTIPFYGDHVSLFTLLMTISTLIYTKINSSAMSDSSMPTMKWMMYIMPIMFLGIFNNFSSGLSYYYLLTNIITIGQQFFIKKFIVNEEKLRKQIQENKSKNTVPKKSKWQQRLEEMAKQKNYRPKR